MLSLTHSRGAQTIVGLIIAFFLVGCAHAIWAYVFTEKKKVLPTDPTEVAELLQFTRKRLSWFFLSQMLIFFGIVFVDACLLDRVVGFEICFGVFMAAMLAHGHIQSCIEKNIRKIPAKKSKMFLMGIRSTLMSLGMMAMYFVVCYGALFLFGEFTGKYNSLKPFKEFLDVISIPISVFIALFLQVLSAPLIFRLSLPVSRAKEDLALRLGELFKRANLPEPSFWILELDDFKSHNALVAGLNCGRGIFKRALFVSRGLVEKFEPDEFDAIMLHEISHIARKHIPKRMWLVLFSVILSISISIVVTMFSMSYLSKYSAVVSMASYFLSLAIQFLFIRWQVRWQEIEADVFAVTKLGGNPEAMASALLKLAKINDMCIDKKDPNSIFEAAAGHPTMLHRIDEIKKRVQRYRDGLSLFERFEALSRIFGAKTKFITTFATAAFVFALVFAGPSTLSKYQLRVAASEGNIEKMQRLLFKGVSVNAPDAISFGETPLIAAAESGKVDAVRFLLDHGADSKLTLSGKSAFYTAVRAGSFDVAKFFLSKGATANEVQSTNYSVLHVAADRGDMKMAKMLLEAGAKVHARDDKGDTPLLKACEKGSLELVKYFLEHGADVNERDHHGSSPLLMASYYGHTDIARLLVEKKAKLDFLDGDGDSALVMAKRNKYKEMEGLLVSAGAKISTRVPASK